MDNQYRVVVGDTDARLLGALNNVFVMYMNNRIFPLIYVE